VDPDPDQTVEGYDQTPDAIRKKTNRNDKIIILGRIHNVQLNKKLSVPDHDRGNNSNSFNFYITTYMEQ